MLSYMIRLAPDLQWGQFEIVYGKRLSDKDCTFIFFCKTLHCYEICNQTVYLFYAFLNFKLTRYLIW